MTAPRKHQHVDRATIVKIGQRLAEVCNETEPGFCKYDDGFDDSVIAAEFGCTRANVAGIRTSMFGKVRKPAPPPQPELPMDPAPQSKLGEILLGRLKELEARVAEIERVYTQPAA